MAAEIYNIHSKNPEFNKVKKVVEALRDGAVMLYPTDTQFTLGCALSNKDAISKIRKIRQIDENHSMTFLCDSLSHLSEFAKVEDDAYKFIKRLIPGPYTFILPASKNVPKFAQSAKRQTSGLRVPQHLLSQTILKAHGEPIITISAKLPNQEFDHLDVMIDSFIKLVDVIVTTDEYNFTGESSIIDLTTKEFTVIREGAGMDKISEFMIS